MCGVAGVVELADAPDSKSGPPCEGEGSTPSSGTIRRCKNRQCFSSLALRRAQRPEHVEGLVARYRSPRNPARAGSCTVDGEPRGLETAASNTAWWWDQR